MSNLRIKTLKFKPHKLQIYALVEKSPTWFAKQPSGHEGGKGAQRHKAQDKHHQQDPCDD